MLLRTPKGKEIFSQAQRKRVVSVREIRSEDGIAGQGIEKKRQEWNAYTALWKTEGLPLPNYTVLVMPDSHTASQKAERQCRRNLKHAFALDSYSSRAEVVDAALSWQRKKKLKGYIALPYRLFRGAAGGFARKIKNKFRG